jgi:amino acid transporter
MTPLTNDEKLENVYQFIEKTKKEQKKEKWILRGLLIGMILAGIVLIAVIV